MKQERLVKHAAMLAIYIATVAIVLRPEVQANESSVETQPTNTAPENLPERYREFWFLNHQLEQILIETSTKPSRLASVGSVNMLPATTLLESKTIPQRLPSTYEEALEFVEEEKTIKGKVVTSEELENAIQKFSPRVQCAVRTETRSLNPYAIGTEFELGPGGLHPFGKLLTFYKEGYDDPFDYEQVLPFMEEQFALGDATHWAGPRDGKC